MYKIWCPKKYPSSLGKYEYEDKARCVARAIELARETGEEVRVLKTVAVAKQHVPVVVRLYEDE